MAQKKIYIGSVGPYLFEDTDLIDDGDGDFSGDTRHGLVTDSQIIVEETPTHDMHIIRLLDMLSFTLFKRHTLESGEDLVINHNEHKLNYEIFTINGTGSLTVDGSGELYLIGG